MGHCRLIVIIIKNARSRYRKTLTHADLHGLIISKYLVLLCIYQTYQVV